MVGIELGTGCETVPPRRSAKPEPASGQDCAGATSTKQKHDKATIGGDLI